MRRKELEITDLEKIRSLISKCKVCRMAMVDEGMPYLVPLSFGYILKNHTLTLYFHSAKIGRKLDILKKNPAICFEMAEEGVLPSMENPCASVYPFRSLMGFGNVEFVETIEEKCAALTLLMQHQVGKDFVFNQAQANSVCIYKVVTDDFCAKNKMPD